MQLLYIKLYGLDSTGDKDNRLEVAVSSVHSSSLMLFSCTAGNNLILVSLAHHDQ